MISILQVFYSVFSGLILSLAIPNEFYLLGMPFLSLFALIPLYFAFRICRNYKDAFWIGVIQTTTTHLCSSFWLAFFKDFAAFTLGASAFGTGLIGGLVFVVMYMGFIKINQNELIIFSLKENRTNKASFRVLYFASIYTIYEWVKSTGFLGYPWGTIPSTIFKWPVLMQLSAITGTYGITFLICCINAIFAELILLYFAQKPVIKNSLYSSLIQVSKTVSILLSFALVYGIIQYNKELIPQKTLTTIMVQQNSDPWKNSSDREAILTSQRLTLEKIEELKQQNKKPEFVIWSEGSLQYYFPKYYKYYQDWPDEKPLIPFIKEINTPLLAGGSYKKDGENPKYFNSALMFDNKGNFRGMYGKLHLVPFAESIPGMNNPVIKKFVTDIVGISAGWTPGEQLTYFDIPCSYAPERQLEKVNVIDLSKSYKEQKKAEEAKPTVRIATPICFDDAFTDVMRPLFLNGAELFMNITDDSWSLKKSSEYQHFVIASYKAIEYRTTLVRSANAGYSVVVLPTGKIVADQPLFQESALAFDVPIFKRTMTTYATLGNWLPYSLIFLVLCLCVYNFFVFSPTDYIPSARKIKLGKKHKKNKKLSKKKKKK